jgi:nitroreductase
METLEAIACRHTIRQFADHPVSQEEVATLIRAGFAAPSNNHLRQWHFLSLANLDRRRQLLDQVIHPLDRKESQKVIDNWGMQNTTQREMYLDAIPLQYSMLLSAPVLLIPLFEQPGSVLHPETLSGLNAFASIWCCIENILIAAADQGLFGVTRIPFPEESKIVKKALLIPATFEFPCWLALGYPAAQARRAQQITIDPLSRLHIDVW